MKTLYRIFLSFVVLSSLNLELYAQRNYFNEVLVYFSNGVQRVRQTTQAVIISSEIRAVFQKHNVTDQQVVAAFPGFVEADTVIVTPDGRKIGRLNYAKIFLIRTSSVQIRDALLRELKKLPSVIFAEPNGVAKPFVIPNDPHFGRQWNMHNTGQYRGTAGADIKGPAAWDIYVGNLSRKIGIIDWGVDASHPDLSGRVSGDTWSDNHGTLVAGIAAANTNNSTGVAGVDWRAQIISRSIANQPIEGIADKVVSGVNAGADVLNSSWGITGSNGLPLYSTVLRDAYAYAYKLNRVTTAAMGNDGVALVNYPAGFGQGIIAVGATRNNDTRASYSTTGNHIDVSAPGGEYLTQTEQMIYSTIPGGGYDYAQGTSMATPHVTGIASLLKGYNTTLANDDIENIINLSVDDINDPNDPSTGPGWDSGTGYGRVNAQKALQRLNPQLYSLTQSYVLGGTDQGAGTLYRMTIYGAQALGLQDGAYWVKRHEVRKTVSYNYTPNAVVWGRGAFTNGWNKEDQFGNNYSMGFCEPVPGTVTSTGATLRTYIYEVFTNSDGSGFLGWYPTPASNVRFEYTVHGIVPLAAPTNLVITNAGQAGQSPNLSWNAVSGATSYKIYRGTMEGSPGTANCEMVPTYSIVGSTTSTNYIDGAVIMDPNSNVLICYYVAAVNQVTESPGSNKVGVHGTAPLRIVDISRFLGQSLQIVPEQFSLSQNHPNPFNPETQITFALPEPSTVQLLVLDVLGREVAILENRWLPAGDRTARWNGRNTKGETVGSGLYFYRISAIGESGKTFTQTMKMLMTK
ncbi:MAG TPA: S8 family serine peptidase [Bacteroidota bacterium]|nr:S8 family serine peptidase [Bacteroidota bacterium]